MPGEIKRSTKKIEGREKSMGVEGKVREAVKKKKLIEISGVTGEKSKKKVRRETKEAIIKR